MNLWQHLWQRALAEQPVPAASTVAILGLVALALVIAVWPATRMGVTIAHEGGHALVAVLTGRRLTGIRLHSDTSGLTLSRGRPHGPGMVATLASGYPAPGLLGFGAAWLLAAGHAVAMLWLLTLALALMLLMIRNFYGLLVMVVALLGVGAASWYLAPLHQSWLAYLVTWTLLLSAPRPVFELATRGGRTSDSAQLARTTGIPTPVWTFLFGVLTVACLVGGVAVLAPGVLGR
ncbi:M50 family metallopeptidase [Naumannella sp. ID2617S]|uniref:M50 family peptidase n=1 Tax=Enemella dayhoffiae TaxID=2016507 RepID=A0A255H5W9_9ACTN|nr:M50 family metallopeptidase [Enemella dayhoffiae]NNG18735.1 M50 family metallopeptidase [Naumannella sp. ID2617S]OYO23068.1 hypothetical protein CGZ93_06280 [Enemella dayhoffiae]